ncbi:hypothetical protein FRC03_002742 [Tulasnella sp. 419]|nr:hypothetical protein FRC03_002742 [Tulasnella sp. 419]
MGEVQHRGCVEEVGLDASQWREEELMASQPDDGLLIRKEETAEEEGNPVIIWEDPVGIPEQVAYERLPEEHAYSYDSNINILGLYDQQFTALSGSTSQNNSRSRSCFNCGSPDHLLPSCPEPRNPERIKANRALLELYKIEAGEDNLDQNYRGLRLFEELLWKKQRLDWLESFQPGKIVGSTLRDALGLNGVGSSFKEERLPWFDGGNAEGSCGGMLFWGYPPGYYCELDPKEAVRARILSCDNGDESENPSMLIIHNNSIEEEEIIELTDESSWVSTDQEFQNPLPRRWARYQTTLFSSELLPISNVDCPLPPPRRSPTPPSPPKEQGTLAAERKALWARLVAGDLPNSNQSLGQISPQPSSNPPPWRLPGAFDSQAQATAAGNPHFIHQPVPSSKNYGKSREKHRFRQVNTYLPQGAARPTSDSTPYTPATPTLSTAGNVVDEEEEDMELSD